MSEPWMDESRKRWCRGDDLCPSETQLVVGCLQRIADATEVMSQRHVELIRQRDFYEQAYRRQLERATWLERRNAALRGVITRMKRQRERQGEA